MGSQELSVSWKDHSSVLVAVFEKLLSNKSLVDCTVAAEGQYLKVHKVVLSACSPYFEVLLNDDIDKHPIIILRDVKFEDLKRIIDFVYRGEVKLPEDQLVEFLNVAESLQIKGLGAGSNDASGKRKFTEDLFARKKTESPSAQKRTRSQLSNTEGKSLESVPSDDLAAHVENAQPSWQPPGSTLVPNNSSSVGTNSITSEFTQNVSNTKTQNDYCASEVTLSTANSVSVSVEPLIPNTRTVVKMELNSDENSEVKDDFDYQTIEDDFPESSYILESDGQGSQPGTSHQYSQMGSSLTSSASLGTDDTLAGSQGVETGRPEGAAPAAAAQHPPAPPSHPAPEPPKTEEIDSKSALHHLFGAASSYLPGAGAQAAPPPPPQPPPPAQPPPRLPNPLARAFPATRLRSAAASILSPQNRLHRYHHQGYFYHHGPRGGGSGAVPKRHYCPECRKPCPSPWYLQRHMRTHTGEKPYRCDSCEMAFSNADNLRRHRRKHTGEDQPFPCEDCGEAFARISALRAHQRAAHTGERPYRCDVCDEAFKQSGHLARHKRTHERHEAVAAAALEAALAAGAPPLDVAGVLHVELVCGDGDTPPASSGPLTASSS